MCVLSVMWALERLNRRTSLPLVYFPAGRLSAVYFCWRCDSSSFLAPRCSLRHKTTLSPFSLSNLSLFYLCYVISLFPSWLCFLKYDLPCVVGHTRMWFTSTYTISESRPRSLSTERRVKRLAFETCLTKKMAACDVTNVLILLWREIYRQTKHCDVTHVCRSSACVLCSFAHSDMIIILVSTEMKVGKWTTIVVKMRLFEIVVKTWMSLNSDISLYPQQRAGAQVCFHLTPGCGIMFHSDSWASPIMSQEAQRTQEWRGENLCQFRAEWLKKCLSFRSGILASCASHFDNERWRAQLSPCHRSCPTSTSFCGFPSPECVYLLFTHIIMTRINTNDAV